jgi:hypothetical protein
MGGFCLHETDVFLAFLDLLAVEAGAFALNRAAIDDLTDDAAAQAHWVTAPAALCVFVFDLHIEL